MSAAFLKIAEDLLRRDVATLDTVDIWQARKLLTAAEADEARAYWHETHPDPAPEPSDPPADTNTNTDSSDHDTQLKTD